METGDSWGQSEIIKKPRIRLIEVRRIPGVTFPCFSVFSFNKAFNCFFIFLLVCFLIHSVQIYWRVLVFRFFVFVGFPCFLY